ncbi:hypothetical protein QVH35_10705 [Candidatus Nitrosotenuis chungbukensis]|uniref:hypothetical protein n=1 Tax=Candidatus Nitrosotenuis chungbukensis TaxID=1353246 RepID=UPI0005B2BC25|nr:hypothetical protein [Candidatus Nitrosotenuis chungbukensis]WKT57763.1 hypothetical protein QVH35_10705 [Candidatus Nitrosotenuis chungbukensis]
MSFHIVSGNEEFLIHDWPDSHLEIARAAKTKSKKCDVLPAYQIPKNQGKNDAFNQIGNMMCHMLKTNDNNLIKYGQQTRLPANVLTRQFRAFDIFSKVI